MKIQPGQTFKDGRGKNIFIVRRDEHQDYPILGVAEGEYVMEEYTENGKFYDDKDDKRDLIIPEGFMVGGVYPCRDPQYSVKIVALSETGKFIGEIYEKKQGKFFAVDYFSQEGECEYWWGYHFQLNSENQADIPITVGEAYPCRNPNYTVRIHSYDEKLSGFLGVVEQTEELYWFNTNGVCRNGVGGHNYYDIVLKSEKEIPLGPEDFPPGTVVQNAEMKEEEYFSVEKVYSKGIVYAGNGPTSYACLMGRKMKYKKPGQTDWNPCSKKA